MRREVDIKDKPILFHKSFFESILFDREDDAEKVECVRVLYEYAYLGKTPNNSVSMGARAFFRMAQPIIDAARERYSRCVENGSKGGRRPSSDIITQVNPTPQRPSSIPTREEVREECRKRNRGTGFADSFYAQWKSRNWIGQDGNPIDWLIELENKEREIDRIARRQT